MFKALNSGIAASAAIACVAFAPAALSADFTVVTPDGYTTEASVMPVSQTRQPGIRVYLNQAKIVKLSAAAATVIIGNPEIADATVRDAHTLVLTGRGFGQTNLVILDGGGNPILDERIAVSRENDTALRIYRQAEIDTYSCEPYCEKAYLTEAEIQSIRAIAEANNTGDNNNN